jgi:hypothetical protein
LLIFPSPLLADDVPTVGMPTKLEGLKLPGPELEAKPQEDRNAPVVVRITEVYPNGPDFRYDLVYYALEPGEFDLRGYLRRKDGSSTANLPPIPVKAKPILPPGQIEPNRLEAKPTSFFVGYKLLWAIGGIVWVAGLVGILFAGRRKKGATAMDGASGPSMADRLRPLVEGAMAGTLSEGQHAELERLLIGYWRRRLGLEDLPPAEAMAAMKGHPEAGVLFRQLEEWLHMPGENRPGDVAALLEPYRSIPAEEPETSGQVA